jgi:hypothetical protein
MINNNDEINLEKINLFAGTSSVGKPHILRGIRDKMLVKNKLAIF